MINAFKKINKCIVREDVKGILGGCEWVKAGLTF